MLNIFFFDINHQRNPILVNKYWGGGFYTALSKRTNSLNPLFSISLCNFKTAFFYIYLRSSDKKPNTYKLFKKFLSERDTLAKTLVKNERDFMKLYRKFFGWSFWRGVVSSRQTITCSKSAMEILEKGVKKVLTLNIFHTFF